MHSEKPLQMFHRLVQRQWQRQQVIKNACTKIGASRQDPGSQNWTNYVIDRLSWEQFDHLIVDEDHKLIYCFVPKVASTNWKRVLLALNRKRMLSQRGSRRAGLPGDEDLDPIQFKGEREKKPTPSWYKTINQLFSHSILSTGNESIVRSVFRTLNEYTNRSHVDYILRNYLKFLFVRNPYERLLSAYRNKFESTYSDYFRLRFGRKIIRGLYTHQSTYMFYLAISSLTQSPHLSNGRLS